MDSYEILGVNKDSSDKEIEVAYEDLKKKYDPSFNTSIHAYKKYREVLNAYENIRNENKRKMYNLKEDSLIKKVNNKEYKLYDFNVIKDEKEIVINDDLEFIKEVVKEDIFINKNISYLYSLLNLKDEINYTRIKKCNDCKEFAKCDHCDGVGVVYYKEKQVYCPHCLGKGKVSVGCSSCNDLGFYNKNEVFSLYVNDEIEERIGLGNEYFDGSKSNLVVKYNFYDKEYISVKGNEISVNYHLSKEETINGVNKTFYSESGVFKLELDSFIENEYSKEVLFNNKKIIFNFYNDKIDGVNKEYYLLINKEYENKILYFNKDYSKCSKYQSEEYFNELVLKETNVIEGFGEEGKYGGNNGDLIIKAKFLNKEVFVYGDNIESVSTSSSFNKLGGKVNGIYHYGFKGNNALICKKGKYYLLSGDDNRKMKLKDYFIYKVISLLILLITPCLMLFIPYSQMMYLVLIVSLLVEVIAVNLIMEVRV